VDLMGKDYEYAHDFNHLKQVGNNLEQQSAEQSTILGFE
jgi:hypothetical protein